MDRLRTALVGCGKVGQTHAQALASLPESEFVAVCDVDFERARAFAGRFHVRPFDDVAACLPDSRLDVLCIATPHPLHAGAAIAAARAGAHVLVEKPLAASLADCDADDRGRARPPEKARRHQPAPLVRAGQAHESRNRRRQDRPARCWARSHV